MLPRRVVAARRFRSDRTSLQTIKRRRALRFCGVFYWPAIYSVGVDRAEYTQAFGAGDARAVGGDAFEAAMSQPGESHGFYPVRIYTVSGSAGDFRVWQQLGKTIHQCRVVRAATADQQFAGIRLSAFQRLNDGQRSQFE